MVYTLKWHKAIAGDGTDVIRLIHTASISANEYTSLDKARAAARRKVNFATGFYMVGVYINRKLQGYVVFDSAYAYGRSSGIFWVPKGTNHDGYYARGVSADGSLNRKLYRRM